MSSYALGGLTVRTREGTVLGVVVGVFAEGPLAVRLRVHGDDDLGCYPAGPQHGVAVYAIPRHRVCQLHDSLVLHTTVSTARSRWLMHVTVPASVPAACRPAAR
jgi:hypothetical protein